MNKRIQQKIAFLFICLFLISIYSLRLGGTVIGGMASGALMEPGEEQSEMITATLGTKVYININATGMIKF
ncbi:MAG: hypothetical protein J7L47_04885 [Candidatus Odinarchaeota archaeon]|nr:hypothetical protein [Candidatus Odinarchaeota archaeon]